jgi:hypothetical protein
MRSEPLACLEAVAWPPSIIADLDAQVACKAVDRAIRVAVSDDDEPIVLLGN